MMADFTENPFAALRELNNKPMALGSGIGLRALAQRPRVGIDFLAPIRGAQIARDMNWQERLRRQEAERMRLQQINWKDVLEDREHQNAFEDYMNRVNNAASQAAPGVGLTDTLINLRAQTAGDPEFQALDPGVRSRIMSRLTQNAVTTANNQRQLGNSDNAQRLSDAFGFGIQRQPFLQGVNMGDPAAVVQEFNDRYGSNAQYNPTQGTVTVAGVEVPERQFRLTLLQNEGNPLAGVLALANQQTSVQGQSFLQGVTTGDPAAVVQEFNARYGSSVQYNPANGTVTVAGVEVPERQFRLTLLQNEGNPLAGVLALAGQQAGVQQNKDTMQSALDVRKGRALIQYNMSSGMPPLNMEEYNQLLQTGMRPTPEAQPAGVDTFGKLPQPESVPVTPADGQTVTPDAVPPFANLVDMLGSRSFAQQLSVFSPEKAVSALGQIESRVAEIRAMTPEQVAGRDLELQTELGNLERARNNLQSAAQAASTVQPVAPTVQNLLSNITGEFSARQFLAQATPQQEATVKETIRQRLEDLAALPATETIPDTFGRPISRQMQSSNVTQERMRLMNLLELLNQGQQ